ncbi:MAG: sulfite exporter TauE/SafE family protein [Thermonemataceae bacterium]|nr:sulfite exporter TauE/SafE family protein [Thermonemataceae bacterium]
MTYILVILASILAGFINTLAGSGSLIMLPLLISLGLSPIVANGTNRVAVVFQSATGLLTFFKKSSIRLQNPIWILFPSLFGALVGAYIATQINEKIFEKFLGFLMIAMLILILLKPEKWLREKIEVHFLERKWYNLLALFVVGLYGGFIQAGVGIFLLIVLVMGLGKNMKMANAYKLIIVALYALPVFFVFLWQNQIHWKWGLITAMGQALGAYIAANFAAKHPKANLYTYYFLIAVLLLSITYFYA